MVAAYASAALLFSLALYVTVSVIGKRDSLTLGSFFRDGGRPWTAVVSLTAYNVTLGTGIAYILTQAQASGYLIYLTPLAVTIGYVAVGWYRGRINFVASTATPNIFYVLSRIRQDGTVEPTVFANAFSGFIGLTYFLLFAFELSVGSSFISRSLLKTPQIELTVAIASLILIVVITYTAISGLRAAVTTDVAQFLFVIAFILTIPYILSQQATPAPTSPPAGNSANAASIASFTFTQTISAVLAIFTAVSTQFYSLVNSQLVSSFQPATQRRVLISAGISSGLIYLVVATIGLVVSSRESLEEAIRSFLYSANPGAYDGMIAFMLFAGMLAVLMSTLDNVAIAVSQQFYDLIEARRKRTEQTELTPAIALRRFRIFYIGIGILVAPVAALLYSKLPNAFYTLLTILFAAGTLSPIVFTAILLRSDGGSTLVDKPAVAVSIGVVVALGWACYVYLLTIGNPTAGSIFHVVAFVASSLFAAIDHYISRIQSKLVRTVR